MPAMETVAKYGLNGSASDGGKVIYNVQEGQVRMSGAPERQPFQFMDQRERKPLYEMAGGLIEKDIHI